MGFTKIVVFNYTGCIGSFYTKKTKESEIIDAINNEYGKGKWTKYHIGN